MSYLEQNEMEAFGKAFSPGQAIAPQVESRNFAQPRQLSAERLTVLGRQIHTALDALAPDLARILRSQYKLTLASLNEYDSAQVFSERENPFLVQGFKVKADLGWCIWTLPAAHQTTEAVITGEAVCDVADESPLSMSETRVVSQLLDLMVGACSSALGLETKDSVITQNHDEVITAGILPPDSETRRLSIHLAFDGPGGPSDILIYLPGVRENALVPPPITGGLPNHLDRVDVAVSARLGSIEVPLSELLDLEVGDVIPLGVELGSTVELFTEDRPCATARWGSHQNNLVVRVERMDEEFQRTYSEPE